MEGNDITDFYLSKCRRHCIDIYAERPTLYVNCMVFVNLIEGNVVCDVSGRQPSCAQKETKHGRSLVLCHNAGLKYTVEKSVTFLPYVN